MSGRRLAPGARAVARRVSGRLAGVRWWSWSWRWLLAPLAALAPLGCSIITEFQPDRMLEQTEERCSDHVDNDGNGLIDCADPSCRAFDFCREDSEARCSDGLDNDADGRVDCRDPDCCGFARCAAEPACGERTAAACTDGKDNDDNGLTDCADFSCAVSECCTRLEPLVEERFAGRLAGCLPPDCAQLQEECCGKDAPSCNVFDPQRWVAWGSPSPRVLGNAFTPNQPCPACAASGVVSVVDATFSPELELEAEVDLRGDLGATISLGLVEKTAIPQGGASCGGVGAPFPLLAGVGLGAAKVEALVSGVARGSATGRASGPQRVRLRVTRAGSVQFFLGELLFHEALVHLAEPYPRVRLLLQGHSATATVDNVLLARRTGCAAPARWVAGPTGPGAVLAPAKDVGRFDAAGISGPAVLLDGGTLRLYYSGRSLKQGSALGVATSTDGQTWVLPNKPLIIVGEDAPQLVDPVVIRRANDTLLAYVARGGAPAGQIRLAVSDDGVAFQRLATSVAPGEATAWDGLEVGAPAIAVYRHRLHVWYVGRGLGSPLPALGLCTSTEGAACEKEPGNPVLRPTAGGHDDRGVADPWVIAEERVLHLWYVGLSWGGRTQINHAASEDGRNWVRFPGNPVLAAGDPGLFGGAEVRGPTVLDHWGTLHLWYGATDLAGAPAIGYAVNTGRPR